MGLAMIVLVVVAAVFGAALGLFMRSALLALAVALAVTGSLQFCAIFVARSMALRPEQADLAAAIQSFAGDGPLAVAPTVAAAGFGALIAALMMAMSLKDRDGGSWLPDAPAKANRSKIRLAQAVEQRPAHIRAESRIDKLLKQ
jgi:hypothetical protein